METTIKKSELRAITYEQARRFFLEQPDVAAHGDDFYYGSCVIRLQRHPDRRLGSLRLPRTGVEFEGGAEELEAIYRLFFYRFLSAGG